jgi:hypothetical protein
MIAATYAYGDTNLSAAPALAKGDDLCLSLGGADGGSTVVAVRVDVTVDEVSDKAVKARAAGMKWGAWFPKAFFRGWSVHAFRDASCSYYRASFRIPPGFRANAGQAMVIRSATCSA